MPGARLSGSETRRSGFGDGDVLAAAFDLRRRMKWQSWLLFVQVMQQRGFSEGSMPSEVRQRLLRTTNLTPGDFATALRREQIMGDTFDPAGLVDALEAECSVKPEAAQRGIGFTAAI